MKGNEPIHHIWHQFVVPLQGDDAFIHRQAIKRRSMQRRKGFKFVQFVVLGKSQGITLLGMGSIDDAGTATGTLFAWSGMGSRISAKKKAAITAHGRPSKGQAMAFAFCHG